MNQLTEIISSLRDAFSQTEISKKTGISQPKLSRWESGEIPAGALDALTLKEFCETPAVKKKIKEARVHKANLVIPA